jgi:hypothetical protein
MDRYAPGTAAFVFAKRGSHFYAPNVAYAEAERCQFLLSSKERPFGIYGTSSSRSKRKSINFGKRMTKSVCGAGMKKTGQPLPPLGFELCRLTEDTDFFGTGASAWTTNGVKVFLKAQTIIP